MLYMGRRGDGTGELPKSMEPKVMEKDIEVTLEEPMMTDAERQDERINLENAYSSGEISEQTYHELKKKFGGGE